MGKKNPEYLKTHSPQSIAHSLLSGWIIMTKRQDRSLRGYASGLEGDKSFQIFQEDGPFSLNLLKGLGGSFGINPPA